MHTVPFSNNIATTLVLGYNATIQCVDITETSVNWTDSNGTFISNKNMLIISNEIPSLNNNLTCTAVLDTNPVSCLPERETFAIHIEGIYIYIYIYMKLINVILYLLVLNVTISGQYIDLTVGSSVSINCTTVPPIPNSEIKWQSSNSDSNELIIDPVMLSHNNKKFTCVVMSDLLFHDLMESIIVTVLGW